MSWQTGEGILVYDPKRPNLKKKNGPWWCVVETRDSISAYYRQLLMRRWWEARDIEGNPAFTVRHTKVDDDYREIDMLIKPPSWGNHISVVRGEEPPDDCKKYWRLGHGKTVTFQYNTEPKKIIKWKDATEFWFLEVRSQELTEIRERLGLKTFYSFHLTIGRRDLTPREVEMNNLELA